MPGCIEQIIGQPGPVTTLSQDRTPTPAYVEHDFWPRERLYLMTDVWVRRDGRWQLVTRHLSPPAPAVKVGD